MESQLLTFSTLLLTRDLASNVRGGSRPRPRHGHHLPVRRGDVLLSAAEFAVSYLPCPDGGGGGAGAAQGHGGHRARGLRPHRLLHRQRDVRGVAAGHVLGHGHGALPGVPGRGGCHVSRVTCSTWDMCYICSAGHPTWSSRTKPRGCGAGEYHSLSRVTCNM